MVRSAFLGSWKGIPNIEAIPNGWNIINQPTGKIGKLFLISEIRQGKGYLS
jgi:hypothetical protein